jgi:hypothetical protein
LSETLKHLQWCSCGETQKHFAIAESASLGREQQLRVENISLTQSVRS